MDSRRPKLIKNFKPRAFEGLFELPGEYPYEPRELQELCLNITDTCNLRCIYCIVAQRVENKKRMSLDEYKNLLAEAVAMNPRMRIVITGGEPLTSPCTVPLARYARKLGISCAMLTNGTLINENNVEELAELFEDFSISIDGSTAEIHDYYRGKGNYEKAKRGVELLNSHGANVSVAMVVTKKNMHDVAKVAEQWGELFRPQPLFPFGNQERYSEILLSGKDYYETLSKIPSLVPYIGLFAKAKENRQRKKMPKCGMGDGMLSISCSGNVYPCNNLHVPKYKLGNVLEQSLTEIYNSSANKKIKCHTVNEIPKCRACDFKLICGGSCQSRNVCENGDLNIASDFCESYDKTAIINGLIDSAETKTL